MPEYRLTRAAEDDLLETLIYGLATFGRHQAGEYRRNLLHCFELLADNPRLGRPADDFAPRARRHEHGRHIIFYDEKPYGILIIAIIHKRSLRRLLPDD